MDEAQASSSDNSQRENQDLRPGWGWASRALILRDQHQAPHGSFHPVLFRLLPARIRYSLVLQVSTPVSCALRFCQREVTLQAGNLKEVMLKG